MQFFFYEIDVYYVLPPYATGELGIKRTSPRLDQSGGGAFSTLPCCCECCYSYCLPLTLNWLARSLLSVLEQLVAFCKRHWLQPWTKIFIMNNNNNNNSTRFSSVNNNNNNNNNTSTGNGSKCSSFCDSCNTGKPSLSQQQPPPIQVTAKVLFGSVTAISALNAERKKKT